MRYAVIQSTPGYMPNDDDPPVFDELPEAQMELREEVERYMDQMADDPERECHVHWSHPLAEDSMSAWIVSDSPHDLGWLIEVVETDEQ